MNENLVFDGNQGVAIPAGGIINIIGDGINIQTIGRSNTLLITSGDSPSVTHMSSKKISLPKTNPSGSEGAMYVDGKVFMHSFSVGAPSVYLGADAGNVSLPSQSNVGIGAKSLSKASGSSFNTAIGGLQEIVSGNFNTAVGYQAMANTKNSAGSTVVGSMAGYNANSSNFLTLFGTNAGLNYSSAESFNVILGCNAGKVDESCVVRIGNDGSVSGCPASQTAYFNGIAGNVVDSAVPVMINTQTGQLGTQGSTATIKTNVKAVSSGSDLLHQLKPVSFNFKGIVNDVVHYGLLAEDVAKVMPELVTRDAQGNVTGVKYMEIISLLVNEVQKLKLSLNDLKSIPAKVNAIETKLKTSS